MPRGKTIILPGENEVPAPAHTASSFCRPSRIGDDPSINRTGSFFDTAANKRRKSMRNSLKSAIDHILNMTRLQDKGGEGRKSQAVAPFSAASVYRHVRAQLDPVKHRHLLGEHESISSTAQQEPVEKVDTFAARKRRATIANLKSFRQKKARETEVATGEVQDMEGADATSTALGIRLPIGKEVADLPYEMQQTLYSVAIEQLKIFLYPRILLRKRLKWRRDMIQQASSHAAHITYEMIKQSKTFCDWPKELIYHLLSMLKFRVFEAGELILHQGEQGSGIMFLAMGTLQLWKRKDNHSSSSLLAGSVGQLRRTRSGVDLHKQKSSGVMKQPKMTWYGTSAVESKKCNEENAQMVATLYPGTVFNEFQFLTKEPRLHYVKVSTKSDCWFLEEEGYDELIAKLSPELKQTLDQKAFQKRCQTMPKSYPMTANVLRVYELFQFCSTAFLDALASKMKPLAVAPGYVFCRNGDPATHLLVFRYGSCGIFRTINGEEMHIQTRQAPCLLNGEAVLHQQAIPETIQSLTGCDLYTLACDDFEAVTSLPQFALEKREMISYSRTQHMQQLTNAQVRFRSVVYNIPILKQILSVDQLNALTFLFEGKVYSPFSLICSAAEECDRAIIVVKGKVSIGKRGTWHVGECAGYTSVIRHRWVCPAVALEPVECIEMPRSLLVAFLRDCNLLDKFTEIVRQLLFPPVETDENTALKKKRNAYQLAEKARKDYAKKVERHKELQRQKAEQKELQEKQLEEELQYERRHGVSLRDKQQAQSQQPQKPHATEVTFSIPPAESNSQRQPLAQKRSHSSEKLGRNHSFSAFGKSQESTVFTPFSSVSPGERQTRSYSVFSSGNYSMSDSPAASNEGNNRKNSFSIVNKTEYLITALRNPVYEQYCAHLKTPPLFPISEKGLHTWSEAGFTPTTLQHQVKTDKQELVELLEDQIKKGTFIPEPSAVLGSAAVVNEEDPMYNKKSSAMTPVPSSQGLLLPSIDLIPEGVKLSRKERKEIALKVATEFNPEFHRKLVKITKYLWIKQPK